MTHRAMRGRERVTVDEILSASGLPAEALPAESMKAFPDGADVRVEIPSVEGPDVLAAVLDEARQAQRGHQPCFPGQWRHAPERG